MNFFFKSELLGKVFEFAGIYFVSDLFWLQALNHKTGVKYLPFSVYQDGAVKINSRLYVVMTGSLLSGLHHVYVVLGVDILFTVRPIGELIPLILPAENDKKSETVSSVHQTQD